MAGDFMSHLTLPVVLFLGLPLAFLSGAVFGAWYVKKGYAGLGAVVGLAAAVWLVMRDCTVACADAGLNNMMSQLGGQVQGDMNGAVQAFAPYLMNVAMLVVGLLLLAGIAFAIARKVF